MTDRTETMDNLIAQDADLIDINNKDSAVLLPCPFCGGVQIEAFHHIDRGWGASWHVECIAEECGNSTCHHDTEATAIAAWNKRQPTQSDDEAYDLGKRDGYEKAVQDIDMLTGGDGEYCYSTIEGERHCPNVDTMKARIAHRLRQPTQSDALREENERLRALLARTVSLAEVYAEGTGTNFKEAMAEARAALQEQSK